MSSDPPPPYKESASMARSRTSRRSVQAAADEALRASLSSPDGTTLAETPTATPSTPPMSELSTGTEAASPLASALAGAMATETGTISPTSPNPLRSPTSPTSTDPPSTPATPVTPVSPSTSADKNSDRGSRRLSSGYLPLMGARIGKTQGDRERILAQENDQLRRELAGQRLLAERDRKEGTGPSFLSRKEEKARIQRLQEEAREARKSVGSDEGRRSGGSVFKAACSTDLLFLIDRTYSMTPHIDSVKKQVKDIVNDIIQAFFGEPEVRIAIVTYTDHGGPRPSISWIDFTTSTTAVFAWLDKLQVDGGDDIPEDVLGGINAAINASWSQPTRCVIHIADAPPHGRIFQDEPYRRDNYPKVGTEPHGLTYEPLLRKMVQLKLNYFFLPINHETDRMALCFSKVYQEESATARLSASNKHRIATIPSTAKSSQHLGVNNSRKDIEGSLLFVEAEPGAIYKHLRSLVVGSVLSSVPRTASRASRSNGQVGKSMTTRMAGSAHPIIHEDEEVELEEVAPKWVERDWLNETIRMEGFCPDIVIHGPKTLANMMQSDDNIRMRVTDLTIHKRSRPFAQGAMRTASYARTAYSADPFVVKAFKHQGKGLAHMTEEMQAQALCKAFALEFNALVSKPHALDFIVTTSLQDRAEIREKGSVSKRQLLSLEPFIPGTYVKFNSNCGYVNDALPDDPVNMAAQAFSHFTFERSRGRLLICDLQGVGNVLTDPAIHTSDPDRFQLTDCNLNGDGFKFFFATHQCNHLCRLLQLKSTKHQLSTAGALQFRDQWPIKATTTCCANKLCGRILHLDAAKMYRKFHWCETCFPQIEKTMMRWPCNGHGLYHTFTASRFFYESQGRLTPRACPTHQVRDESVPGPPKAEGTGVLKRLSFWGKKA